MFFYTHLADNRPIGVFDSGIGGLTVAAAIARRLPAERIVYFGDTAHLPYGEKSPAALRSYAVRIVDFLKSQDCKAIVIACNTASAVANEAAKKRAGKEIPVINVIEPTVKLITRKYNSGRIGVIATKATVNSRVYARRMEKHGKDLKVTMLATPLLVSMIEEGFFNNNISQAIINSYLERPSLKGIEALILGCTHFPLIKKEVEKYYNGSVEVIDSSETVASAVEDVLSSHKMRAESRKYAHRFFVSDLTQSFAESTQIFFGEKLRLEKKNLWE